MQPAASPTTMEIMIWKNFMTMPSTAMGICVNSRCAKTASRALYLRTMLLMAAMAMTSEICERKLHMPRGRNARSTDQQGWKLFRQRETDFMRQRYHRARPEVRAWPSTVATAAPVMPQWKPKMNTGSSARFTAAPARVEIMAKRGLPSERMMGFMAWPNM